MAAVLQMVEDRLEQFVPDAARKQVMQETRAQMDTLVLKSNPVSESYRFDLAD